LKEERDIRLQIGDKMQEIKDLEKRREAMMKLVAYYDKINECILADAMDIWKKEADKLKKSGSSRQDVNKAFDISEKQCKKGARVLNIYSGTIDWSFYDKISDSLRPKNKRNDKSHIGHERSVIERYNLQEREVFRYEYRIKKTQTTKREINTLLGREYSTQVVFKDLFTPNLLKTLVLNSWHALIERPENQISLFSTIDKLGLFLHILSEAKKRGEKAHSMNNALISYGLATAIRDHGAKEVRGAIFDVWSNSHSERLTKKIELSSELTKRLPYSNNITFIDTALERYELITLTSLENGV
jgi:hypothetical protein